MYPCYERSYVSLVCKHFRIDRKIFPNASAQKLIGPIGKMLYKLRIIIVDVSCHLTIAHVILDI